MAHITVTTQPPIDAPPTVTHYQQLVAEFMEALDRMVAIIPKLAQAESSLSTLVRNRLRVPDSFCATVVSAVEQLPELKAAGKLDPIQGRDKLQFLEAFRPLYDKAFAFTKRLHFALMMTKSTLASESLQMYRIAKNHASDDRSPLMAAHVANMKRDLGVKVPTKAEREQQQAEKLAAAVEEQVAKRLDETFERRLEEAVAMRLKQVNGLKEVETLAA